MPNYVTNRVEFQGKKEDIAKVLELIKSEDSYIDFNKIIPTPDYIYQGNLGEEERKLYGENNWYTWNCANWGTKWNACYSYLADDDVLVFDTAWASPIPILEKLAEICYEHNVSFIGKWADEDAGSNTGTFESWYDEDGYDFDYNYVEDLSDEAYEIYEELN